MRISISKDQFALVLFTLLSLIPVARLVIIINASCSNVVYFDFVHVMGIINAFLSNTFNYSRFFQDMSLGGHPQIAPLLFHILNAKFFGLNNLVEEYLCLGMMYSSTVLNYQLFVPETSSRWRYALLPILSFTQFTLGLSSEFFYQYSFASDAINRLAFSLGLWSIARVKNTHLAALMLIVSGFVCSTCAAGYVASCWATFLFIAICTKRLNKYFLIAFAMGFCISILPTMLIVSEGHARIDPAAANLAFLGRFLTSINLALLNKTADDIPVTTITSITGLLALTLLLWLTAALYSLRGFSTKVYCALSHALFGLLNLLPISLARQFIRPWYGTYSVFFWTTVLTLAFALLVKIKSSPSAHHYRLHKVLAILTIAIYSCFYFSTNRTYADKDWFRNSHNPAAESNLRAYQWAPTYAANSFDSLKEYWQFAGEVALHNLSAFNSKQVWSLQGDFALPTVITGNRHGTRPVQWVSSRNSSKQVDYSTPEHLFVAIPSGGYVLWSLRLPKTVKSADLVLNVCTQSSNSAKQKLTVEILSLNNKTLNGPFEIDATTSSNTLRLPLRDFANKSIKVYLANQDKNEISANTILVEYPRVRCNLGDDHSSQQLEPSPCNVDSASDQFATVAATQTLGTNWQTDWTTSNIAIKGEDSSSLVTFVGQNDQARLIYTKQLAIDPRQWHEFVFEAAHPKDLRHGFFLCEFTMNSGRLKRAVIPILADGQLHKYTYQLKLIQAIADESICFVQLYPLYTEGPERHTFKLRRIGFITRNYVLPNSNLK